MSINFLIQTIRVLHVGAYNEKDLVMIYNFLTGLDYDCLKAYFETNSVLSYTNDLELYIEILDGVIKIYEDREEYEKCAALMEKKKVSQTIMEYNN